MNREAIGAVGEVGGAVESFGSGDKIRQGLADFEATGSKLSASLYRAWLATAHLLAGSPEDGLAVIGEALHHVDQTGEHTWEEAELYRLSGVLTLEARISRPISRWNQKRKPIF